MRRFSDFSCGFTLKFVVLLISLTVSCAYDICTCNQLTCDVPSNCTHGLVLDRCGCCMVCARGVHEFCGGSSDSTGVCAAGLQCVIHARPGDLVTGKELGTCEGKPFFSSKYLHVI